MLAAGIDLLPESGCSARLGNRDDAEPYLLGHKPVSGHLFAPNVGRPPGHQPRRQHDWLTGPTGVRS